VPIPTFNQIVPKLLNQSRADQTCPLPGTRLVYQEIEVIDWTLISILTALNLHPLNSIMTSHLFGSSTTELLQPDLSIHAHSLGMRRMGVNIAPGMRRVRGQQAQAPP